MPQHLDRDSLIKIPEMGEHVATHKQYFNWFADTSKKHIQDNLDSFKQYLNVINRMFPQDFGVAIDSVQAIENLDDFHSDLLTLFYSRVYKRILFTIKKRRVDRANYFKTTPSGNDERTQDLTLAIQEELQTAITMYDAKNTADKAIQGLDNEEFIEAINEYKKYNHGMQIRKHALPFKITETILGAGTKINSTTKRMDTTSFFQPHHPLPVLGHDNPPHMSTLHPPHMTDLQPAASVNKQWGISPTSLGFQITGIVFSGLWLIYNVISLAFHKKKENRKIFSFDNMREALPSLLFLPLGLVALLTPIGMWLSIVFALHSILDVGYKLYEHIKNRNKAEKDIDDNLADIARLTDERTQNASKTTDDFETFKNLDLAAAADQSIQLSDAAKKWQTGDTANTEKLLTALSQKDKLEIERINRSNNFAAFSYSTRLTIAIIGAIGLGLTLSFVPPLMFAGSMILVATTCVTTIIFVPQIINRFYSHYKINKLKQNRMREYGVDTIGLFMAMDINFENFRKMEAEKTGVMSGKTTAAAPVALEDIHYDKFCKDPFDETTLATARRPLMSG